MAHIKKYQLTLKQKAIFRLALILSFGLFFGFSHGKTIYATSLALSNVKAALSSASSGDIIALPAGNITWSGPLNINKTNITIQGSGIGSTIISGSGMLFTTTGETANYLRITDLEIHGCEQCIYGYGSGTPRQTVKNFRVDNCKFVDNYITMETNGGGTGVFDHNIFLNTYGFRFYGSNDANAKFPANLGTSDAIFIEDNTISVTSKGTPPHFIASNSWSKYVVRHNTFDYAASLWDIVDAHGYCEVQGRGSATWEIYDNVFKLCPTINRVIHLRGGQGVVYGNTFLNYKPSDAISITDYAGCNPPCVTTCSSYPCKDQINRSYFWNNKIGDTPANPISDCNFVKLNRDYYNSPMPGYEPYTYPHPLTQQNVSQPTTVINSTGMKVSNLAITISPKPFSPLTTISYELKEKTPVHMAIYNVQGSLITMLVNNNESAGSHSITWNASKTPKGIYFLKTTIGDKQNSFKLIH